MRYVKAVDGTYYVVEAVPDSKKKTAFIVSVYMQKKTENDAPYMPGPNATSETQAPINSVNNKISQNTSDVNFEEESSSVKRIVLPCDAEVRAPSSGYLVDTTPAPILHAKDIKGDPIENVDYGTETVAELTGEYLFTDEAFVSKLAEHRNLFQRVYDKIRHYYNMAVAGSP